jgi:hypothetical protein
VLHCCLFCCCRDVFLQKTPTNFDASVDELWTALTAGATLVVAPPEAHRDVHSVMTLITRYDRGLLFCQLVSRHGGTTLEFLPGMVCLEESVLGLGHHQRLHDTFSCSVCPPVNMCMWGPICCCALRAGMG